jgi:hypothetical protein
LEGFDGCLTDHCKRFGNEKFVWLGQDAFKDNPVCERLGFRNFNGVRSFCFVRIDTFYEGWCDRAPPLSACRLKWASRASKRFEKVFAGDGALLVHLSTILVRHILKYVIETNPVIKL